MEKTVFQFLSGSIPEAQIIDTYSSGLFVGVETDEGAGIAISMYGDASLRMAQINAHYNRGDRYFEPYENYCTSGLDFEGKTVGVIGNMRGIGRRYGDIAKSIYVFDYNSDIENGILPAEKEDELLPLCDIVVISGSAVINGSADHILSIAPDAYKILVGPSVTMCPELLDFGFDRLSGMVVSDVEKMRTHIKEGVPGSPYYFGTPFLIKKEKS